MKDTLSVFAQDFDFVAAIPFYTEGVESDALLRAYVESIDESDRVVVFTDVANGSVDQKALVAFKDFDNVRVISGYNLPLLISFAFAGGDAIGDAFIEEAIEGARAAISKRVLDSVCLMCGDE